VAGIIGDQFFVAADVVVIPRDFDVVASDVRDLIDDEVLVARDVFVIDDDNILVASDAAVVIDDVARVQVLMNQGRGCSFGRLDGSVTSWPDRGRSVETWRMTIVFGGPSMSRGG